MPDRRAPMRRSGTKKPRHEDVEIVYDETGLGWEVSNDVDPEWPIARQVALRRDHYTCRRCGGIGTDPHHRVARGKGGNLNDPTRHSPEKLVTLCRSCHSWAHLHPTDAKDAGYIVPPGDDPAATPVRMYHGTALLGQDGRMETLTVRYR